MDQGFATKLRLTAAALGCTSRKAFCAAFRAVNPATHCELDRLHKWLQGRAAPRSRTFYDDWAKVLGSSRPGAWFASCTQEAFLAELCMLFGVDAEDLINAEPFGAGQPAHSPSSPSDGLNYLLGAYACYSYSWSPYYRGKLIRGGMLLAPGRGGALAVTYTEALLGGTIRFRGEGAIGGTAVYLRTRDSSTRMELHFHVFVPGPPASAMLGIMSGPTILGDEPRISAGRIVMIRVPDEANLEGSNRYVDPVPDAIVSDLMALGLPVAAPDEIDMLTLGFLHEAGDCAAARIEQVSATDQVRLTAALHKSYLDRGQAPSKGPAKITRLRSA